MTPDADVAAGRIGLERGGDDAGGRLGHRHEQRAGRHVDRPGPDLDPHQLVGIDRIRDACVLSVLADLVGLDAQRAARRHLAHRDLVQAEPLGHIRGAAQHQVARRPRPDVDRPDVAAVDQPHRRRHRRAALGIDQRQVDLALARLVRDDEVGAVGRRPRRAPAATRSQQAVRDRRRSPPAPPWPADSASRRGAR